MSFAGHIIAPRLDRMGRPDFHMRFDFRGQAQVFRTNALLTQGILIVAVRREELDMLREFSISADQDRFDESAGGNILAPVQPIEWLQEEDRRDDRRRLRPSSGSVSPMGFRPAPCGSSIPLT